MSQLVISFISVAKKGDLDIGFEHRLEANSRHLTLDRVYGTCNWN